MSMPSREMEVNRPLSPLVCYGPQTASVGGSWLGDDPLDFPLTLLFLQIIIMVMVSRATAILLRPLYQPRYVAEIITGIILGPSALGNARSFAVLLFPLRSVLFLETLARLGLIYFMFVVGVKTELGTMRRMGRAVAFAVPCMAVPFAIGAASGKVLVEPLGEEAHGSSFATLLGITLSITSFSMLARTLDDFRLLHSPVGATALSSAMLIDSCGVVLLPMAITLSKGHTEYGKATLAVMISGIALFAVCLVLVRPAAAWVEKRTPEGEEVDDLQACVLLVGVMAAAFAGEAIGISAVSGAFVYGLVFPNGPLGASLIERVEELGEGILLPLFFAVSGLRTNLLGLKDGKSAVFLVLVGLVAAMAKVAMCLLVSLFFRMPLRDGFATGLLMNTKGVIELVILNLGWEKKVVSTQSFSILVVTLVVVTGLVRPLLMMVFPPQRQGLSEYDRQMVRWPKPGEELRVLVCVHTERNVATMIGLLEASHHTQRAPIVVYALHLIELTGRASAMVVAHSTAHQSAAAGRIQAQSEHIVTTFQSYEQHAPGVSIQHLTAVSPYPTMHEDVCGVAEDRGVALIVLPFHKQQTVDGGMEVTNPAVRSLNQAVLASAHCSVAILVDRTLGGAAPHHASHHVVLIFIGGPDDREALAYASRMAEHPSVSLLVLRLVPGGMSRKAGQVQDIAEENELQRKLDEECLAEFRLKKVSEESVVFKEEEVNNVEEAFAAIREVDSIHDLYIVGRGKGRNSPLTAGFTEWSECPELGPVGDFLASSDFAATVSVLVVQQCAPDLTDLDAGSLRKNNQRAEV